MKTTRITMLRLDRSDVGVIARHPVRLDARRSSHTVPMGGDCHTIGGRRNLWP